MRELSAVELRQVEGGRKKPNWGDVGKIVGTGVAIGVGGWLLLGNDPTVVRTPHGNYFCPKGIKNGCRPLN